VKDRIGRKLEEASRDPRRFLTRLASVGAYRLRVGDYRVILDMDWDREALVVLTLGHRKSVYR